MQQAPEAMTLKVIAHIHTAFPTKFGIPRQSGLVEELRGEIVFTPEYRNPDAPASPSPAPSPPDTTIQQLNDNNTAPLPQSHSIHI